MILISRDDLISKLVDEQWLRSGEVQPNIENTSGHGSCCYCLECGYFHDECVCSDNELLALINCIKVQKVLL